MALGTTLVGLLVLAACAAAPAAAPPPAALLVVTHTARDLAPPSACEGRFVAHPLGVTTGARMREIATYASNGAGLAAGDLDGDGRLDLVLASIDREATILWNDGGLRVVPQPLEARFTRAVAVVDVDGDGALDITFSHRGRAAPSLWRNLGARRFAAAPLPGVDSYAYALAWADLQGDGALDLVTGAYDAELKNFGLTPDELRVAGGVTLYEQRDGAFVGHRLADRAEALAIGLMDLDDDARPDVWVGNDFAVPDACWVRQGAAWRPDYPFAQTSHSTMSIDWGDLANDGRMALFTTDMNPGDVSVEVLAQWLPVISTLEEKHGPFDPQIMANTLQVRDWRGAWQNEAARRGVDATGWSWSGRFGDLDNDGFLDLYVVNGMIASNLFGYLPGGELVEANRAFRNRGDGTFAAAPEWGLGDTASGRGMLPADMDGDGDLDVVVNNLRGQAVLFENRLCGGAGLAVDLRWPGSPNPYAIGARLELVTSAGTLRRDVRVSSGYLSGDAPRVHFGVPAGATLERLVIRYPDGAVADVRDLRPHTLIEVLR